MMPDAQALAEKLSKDGHSVGVVNARFAKPIDSDLLISQTATAKVIITMEDGVITGGFGSAVLECLAESNSSARVVRIGWPDAFVGHATDVKTLRAQNGLSPEQIYAKVQNVLSLT
jgi:1-deoxy-D-xylulose-5-phosphate synthase